MFKRIFQYAEDDAPKNPRPSTVHSATVVRLSNLSKPEKAGPQEPAKAAPPVLGGFEEIYAAAEIPVPAKGYTILKIAEMLNNRHLADMTPDAKRNSLMMALEAAEIEVGELLQDAVARNRALDEYEDKRLEEMKTFESVKAEENNQLHAEMERLTSQYLARIQANSDHVAREQDNLRAWQKRKQLETQRITDAATFCVPQGNGGAQNGLSAVLERVTVRR
ncbi:MAG TPA: hypothetical protein VMB03_19425 [Bryobacteraceae bacterium]|nr:hypothetical protein [Bryobacteraceae bacterium]